MKPWERDELYQAGDFSFLGGEKKKKKGPGTELYGKNSIEETKRNLQSTPGKTDQRD